MDRNKLVNLKKRILLVSSLFFLYFVLHKNHRYEKNYKIMQLNNIDYEKPYATYKYGNVYIVPPNEVNEFLKTINKCDLVIADGRSLEKDPYMKIYGSCNVDDKDAINDVLEIILYYESINPSDWDRTLLSMRNEWVVHNILSDLNYRNDHTDDVDLDNDDEKKYDSKVLKKVLHN